MQTRIHARTQKKCLYKLLICLHSLLFLDLTSAVFDIPRHSVNYCHIRCSVDRYTHACTHTKLCARTNMYLTSYVSLFSANYSHFRYKSYIQMCTHPHNTMSVNTSDPTYHTIPGSLAFLGRNLDVLACALLRVSKQETPHYKPQD